MIFTKVFNNTAGAGAIGKITIPYFLIPTGYFMSELMIDVQAAGLTAGAGSLGSSQAQQNAQNTAVTNQLINALQGAQGATVAGGTQVAFADPVAQSLIDQGKQILWICHFQKCGWWKKI